MPGSILPFCSCLPLPWVARFGYLGVIGLLVTLLEVWAQGAVVPVRLQPLPELGHRALADPTPACASLAGTANFSLPDSRGSWCSTGFHLSLSWRAIWKPRGEFLVWAQGHCPSVAGHIPTDVLLMQNITSGGKHFQQTLFIYRLTKCRP